MNVLAFDFGASSGRAILGRFDGGTLTLEETHRFANEPVTLGRHLHWDLPRLLRELLHGCSAAYRAAGGHVETLGVNTWGVDFGLLDKHGLLMGNPFHYRDGLTESAREEFFSILPRRSLYERTGLQMIRFNTLFQLFALQRAYPDFTERARRLMFIPDLLNYYLTGQTSCEYTIASTSQLLDVRKRTWDAGLLKLIPLDSSLLSAITPAGTPLGPMLASLRAETGLSARVVSVCGHDTASAVLAVPYKPGEQSAYLSCGTWSLLGVEMDEPLTHDAAYEADYTNEGGYGGNIRFLKNIMGLWISQEIRREYVREHGDISFDEMMRLSERVKPFSSLINPDNESFMEPGGMAGRVREYCKKTGQAVPEDIGALERCATESLALKYRYVIENLERVLGYRIPALRIVGGGCKNKALMQAAANALSRPVYAGPVEATALGNLCAQLITSGELKNKAEARTMITDSFPMQIYAPSGGAAWDEAYGKFCGLINNEG